ncbi:MAG: hotdog domain-containing protein [Coriobacteriia bacterium]|nr:hotdog domain-containing protein [Coriobacteriia bacterium]
MLALGLKGAAEMHVTLEDTARSRKSGTLDVLATPALAELIERCCWESVAAALDEGQVTVGTRLDLRHNAPTPVGMRVRCESELVAIDRRALTFEVRAFDEAGEIATARHDRFIVDAGRFQQKADAR